jgi:hypothetical protein
VGPVPGAPGVPGVKLERLAAIEPEAIDPALRTRLPKASEPVSLYAIINELRLEYPTPAASRALDMVVKELGETHDNLKDALARLEGHPFGPAGRKALDELKRRAEEEGVDDLHLQPPPDELEATYEPLDEAQLGIAALLGVSGLIILVLGLFITVTHPVG